MQLAIRATKGDPEHRNPVHKPPRCMLLGMNGIKPVMADSPQAKCNMQLTMRPGLALHHHAPCRGVSYANGDAHEQLI